MNPKSIPSDINVGDVLKCIVIENKNQGMQWRAYPYTEACIPVPNTENSVEIFTNKLMANKCGIEIIEQINFGKVYINQTKTIFVSIVNKSLDHHILESVDNEIGKKFIRFKSFVITYGNPIDRPFIIPPKNEMFVELLCDAKYVISSQLNH
jgi:hypothetical protein